MEVDFSTISPQIETLSKLPSEAIQDALSPNDARELRRNLNKLSVALESPGDIVDRIVYAVSSLSHHLPRFCHGINVWMLSRY